jgi:hypothetical protein
MLDHSSSGIVFPMDADPEKEWSSIDGVIGEGVAATYNSALGWVGSLSSLEGGKGY